MTTSGQYTVDDYGKPIPPKQLKPCPLCGAEAVFLVGLHLCHVRCSKCRMGMHATKAAVLCKAWNKRTKVSRR